MAKFMDKLISIGGPQLSSAEPRLDADLLALAGPLAGDLVGLLARKNGFYVFESALHIRPARSFRSEVGIVEWNSNRLWIDEYRGLANGYLFFAEDVFGGQFCIKADGVYQFEPETGQVEKLAVDLEGWADLILRDYKILTGHPLAHEWQRANGKIASGVRLVPKVLFVAGGEFSVQNLYPLDSAASMRMRGSVAVQIKDLPDGAAMKLKIVD